jgi:acid phosphatase (class A)
MMNAKRILFSGVFCLSTFAYASDWRSGTTIQDFQVQDPPAAGSQQAHFDIEVILNLQETRTDAQCAQINGMGSASFKLFKAALGKKEYQKMKPLMDDVTKLTADLAKTFKNQFQRPRPANEDSRVHPCQGISDDGYSYPSTHATVASSAACVLGQVYPDHADILAAFARDLGQQRVLGGFHHPSDIQAGEKLGADICQHLLSDSGFQKELKALQ